ncbi:uncharacterized protein LOC125027737 [Penaeus chinensis]|uniref:uncharacterized protein LOC125027737 n=1 Tax=Penaeus chinensis TaxID=139456 RepID=UPI001FB68637|nr:uncharacterized protein LOC125027737 [Penaeus chinensis]
MWFPNGNYLMFDNKMHRAPTPKKRMYSPSKQKHRATKYEKTKCPIPTRRKTESILHQQLLEIISDYKYLDMKNSARFKDYTQIQNAVPHRRHVNENVEFLLGRKSYGLGWRGVKLWMAEEVLASCPVEPRDAFRRRVTESASFAEAEGLQGSKVAECPLLKVCKPCTVVLHRLNCSSFA